jgi:hypothetical protein
MCPELRRITLPRTPVNRRNFAVRSSAWVHDHGFERAAALVSYRLPLGRTRRCL